MALAYVSPEYDILGSEVSVEILNKPCEARAVSSPLYDPRNMRLRG
ncbi:MAG: hypothetical protein JRF47_17210 [Deltaproteobacteria bacterium]|nr:hypothetical protein [Deltaproteobacteria bacterium]